MARLESRPAPETPMSTIINDSENARLVMALSDGDIDNTKGTIA